MALSNRNGIKLHNSQLSVILDQILPSFIQLGLSGHELLPILLHPVWHWELIQDQGPSQFMSTVDQD